jgi:hypothetical protein
VTSFEADLAVGVFKVGEVEKGWERQKQVVVFQHKPASFTNFTQVVLCQHVNFDN